MSDIIQICIFHYLDYASNMYLGYVEQNKKNTACLRKGFEHSDWYNNGSFYAVNPDFKPMPVGMKLFCAKYSYGFPFDTVSIDIEYDPYNRMPGCTYFMTYNEPVPHTKPLYIHRKGKHVFPSWDQKPPVNEFGWELNTTLYVLTTPYAMFKCINSRCLPTLSNGLNLNACIDECVESSKGENRQKTILNIVKKETKQPLRQTKAIYQHRSYLILACSILILILILVLILIETKIN